MSNIIEMINIPLQRSDRCRYPAISVPIHPSESFLDHIGADEDIGQNPSSIPLLSPFDDSQDSHGSKFLSIFQWALVLSVPALTIAYLTFCYVVHYRVVPANMSGLSADMTIQFTTNIGSVITSINIIIVSLALFPLKGFLSELKAEEFFRLISSRRTRGVELSVVNGISNPSYGFIESILVVIQRHCSLYYAMALIAGVVVWAPSTLAPAALSIQPVLMDGAVMAFPVGAIPPLALYQPVAGGQTILPSAFSPAPGYAAAVIWAEREIGLSYSFSVLNDSQGVYSGFVVPTPPLLNSTVSARWLTDVIGFNPYCTWANPANLTTTSFNYTMNSTKVPENAVTVRLQDVDLQVSVPSSYFPVYDSFFVTSINVHNPTATIHNHTTGSLATDGAMVMSVIQCVSTSCTADSVNIIALFMDLSDVPSMRFNTIGADYDLGFLVCKPNITIETREIRTQGSMTLEVQPLADSASPHPRQGNLDWTQTSLLVAYSMSALSTDSGPASSAWTGLGSATQVDFLFGRDQMDAVPPGYDVINENTTQTLQPLTTDNLAHAYTQMVKAAMKPYVSGLLGTSYVPGRIATVQQIFVSSLPHVITSTVLFLILLVMAAVAHFRPGRGEQFNLTNVAAALADSELAAIVKRERLEVIEQRKDGKARRGKWLPGKHSVGQEVAQNLGKRKVFLERPVRTDEVDALHISRE